MLGKVSSIEQKSVLSSNESLEADVPYFEYVSCFPDIFGVTHIA